MANSRNYSNTSVNTTLNGAITNVGTSVVLTSQTGMPTPPFVLSLEPDTVNEELMLVTSGAGTGGSPYVVTRGYDGTASIAHSSLVTAQHRVSAVDFTDSRTHEASSANIHGLNGASLSVNGGTSGLSSNSTVSGTSSETALGKVLSIAGNSLAAGSLYRVTAFGTVASTGVPTITFRLKYGGTILATTTLTFNSGASSEFVYDGVMNVQSIGGSGSMAGYHRISAIAASFSAGATAPIFDVSTLQTGVSTTSTQNFSMTVQYSAASGSNIATALGASIEQLF